MSQDRGKGPALADLSTGPRQGHNTKAFESPFKVDAKVDGKRDDPVWHFVARGRYLDGSTAAGRKLGRRCLCKLCGRSICGGAKSAREHFSKSEKFRCEVATPAVWYAIWAKDMTKCLKEFASAIESLQSLEAGHPRFQWPPLRYPEDSVPAPVSTAAPSGVAPLPGIAAPTDGVTVPLPTTTRSYARVCRCWTSCSPSRVGGQAVPGVPAEEVPLPVADSAPTPIRTTTSAARRALPAPPVLSGLLDPLYRMHDIAVAQSAAPASPGGLLDAGVLGGRTTTGLVRGTYRQQAVTSYYSDSLERAWHLQIMRFIVKSRMTFNCAKLESFKRMFTMIIPSGIPEPPTPKLPTYHMLRTTLLDELDADVLKCVLPILDTGSDGPDGGGSGCGGDRAKECVDGDVGHGGRTMTRMPAIVLKRLRQGGRRDDNIASRVRRRRVTCVHVATRTEAHVMQQDPVVVSEDDMGDHPTSLAREESGVVFTCPRSPEPTVDTAEETEFHHMPSTDVVTGAHGAPRAEVPPAGVGMEDGEATPPPTTDAGLENGEVAPTPACAHDGLRSVRYSREDVVRALASAGYSTEDIHRTLAGYPGTLQQSAGLHCPPDSLPRTDELLTMDPDLAGLPEISLLISPSLPDVAPPKATQLDETHHDTESDAVGADTRLHPSEVRNSPAGFHVGGPWAVEQGLAGRAPQRNAVPGVVQSGGGEGTGQDPAQPRSGADGQPVGGDSEHGGSSTTDPYAGGPVGAVAHGVGGGHAGDPRPHLPGICPPPPHPPAVDPAAHGLDARSALPTMSFYNGASTDRGAGDMGHTSACGPTDVPAGTRLIGHVDGSCHESMRAFEERHGRPIQPKTEDVHDTRMTTARLSQARKKGTGMSIPFHRHRPPPIFRYRDKSRQMSAAADGQAGADGGDDVDRPGRGEKRRGSWSIIHDDSSIAAEAGETTGADDPNDSDYVPRFRTTDGDDDGGRRVRQRTGLGPQEQCTPSANVLLIDRWAQTRSIVIL
ncbi:hypothetical protein CBR_g31039 [Chara braunii]|uniref:Uncharacterized protein n=1 Tax=Chara braunii TaxID=69332 RepID=A0A388LE46_CHABU|nr:hypothetical protein CBR_g31039 [Chara braunii]|eukprot:GBG80579.1 hypothetical protein CBR_g31039 [Chara braunii]